MKGYMTTKEIAQFLGVSSPTITHVANDLGMIRKHGKQHGRSPDYYTLEQYVKLKSVVDPKSSNKVANKFFDSYWRTKARIMIEGSGDESIYSPIFDK